MFEISLIKETINKFKYTKKKKPYKIDLKYFAPKILQRSLKLRVVDAGDDEGTMAELYALEGPEFSIQSYGIDFVASPKHADGILIVGSIPKNMQLAVLDTYNIITQPKIVIACGDKAIHGDNRFENCLGVKNLINVDLSIHGNPPTALDIFSYLLCFTKNI